MRHERPRDTVHARIAGERSLDQLGQLSIEAGRQVVADLPQLLVHDVEVIDEPFRRRRDRALLTDGVRDHSIRFTKHTTVVLDPPQETLPAARPLHDGLGSRQALRVLLETFDTEELGADRVFGRRPGHAHKVFVQGLEGGRGFRRALPVIRARHPHAS